ncbi:MAG: PTS sugar transporter subunit IIA [Deltaproteobacteria bacterium]|nr:PTS sugar transporter subunit IIA [Deltaproteobacteria bacterium]
MDSRPAHLFFLIAAPEKSVGVHLTLLARINRVAGMPEIRERLMQAPDAKTMREIIDEADEDI